MSGSAELATMALPEAATEAERRPLDLVGRLRRLASVAIPPFLFFLGIIGFWIFISLVWLHPSKRFLLPPPWQVLTQGFLDPTAFNQIMTSLWLTMKAAIVGYGIAIAIGMTTAITMSQAKWLERSIYPYAVILQTIPILALVPVIGFTLGYDFPSRVLVTVLIALFPIITNSLFGLLSVEKGMHDLFTLHNVGRWERLWKLQLPAGLPAIFTGLRTSAGLAVVGSIVGDFFFQQGDPGIGSLINLYINRLETQQLYAAVIVSSLVGVLVFVLVGLINQRVVGRWHTSTRGN